MLRLAKAKRLAKRYAERLEGGGQGILTAVKLCGLLLAVLLSAHFVSCCWYWLGTSECGWVGFNYLGLAFGASCGAGDPAHAEMLAFVETLRRCGEHAPVQVTFSRTVRRLYGGSKGLVMGHGGSNDPRTGLRGLRLAGRAGVPPRHGPRHALPLSAPARGG